MKKKIDLIILVMLAAGLLLTACSDNSIQESGYMNITPQQAKEIMETEKDFVILDVRTQEEYDEGHIEGAVLLPDYEVSAKAESVLPLKDQLILVYCRSGRRSKGAAQTLVNMGYTNIKEFGGILDWPYEIVK